MVPWDARAVPALRLDVAWAAANDWSTPTVLTRGADVMQVQLDEQADSLSVALRVPWGVVLRAPEGSFLHRLATAIELRGTIHWGGWMDGPIEAWHQIFSYNDFNRPDFPKNQVHVSLHPEGSPSPVQMDQATFAFGDVVLRNQLLLWQGGEPLAEGPPARAGVSLRLDLKIPTGSLPRLGGSGGFDLGLGLLGTWQAMPWLVGHAIVSGSYWSPMASSMPMQPRSWQASAGLSLVALVGEWSFLLEDRWLSPAFEWGWAYANPTDIWTKASSAYAAVTQPQNQITVGVRWGPLTFWFMEDFTLGYIPGTGSTWFYDTNAPDVAIGLTLTVSP